MMAEFDEYLNALEVSLSRHLSIEQRQQRIDEIRSHLAMDMKDREAAGHDPEYAARLARRALGSPEVLARQMIRQARGYDSASPWKLTTSCGIALVVGTVVPFYFVLQARPPFWANIALHWLPFFALIYFGMIVARTRRWLVAPMASWAALLFVGMFVVGIRPQVQAPVQEEAAMKSMNTAMQSVEKELEPVRAWRRGVPPVDQAPIGGMITVEAYYTPTIPIDVSFARKTSYQLSSVRPEEAPNLWAANGALYEKDIHERLANLRETAGQRWHPVSGGGFSFWRILWLFVLAVAKLLAIYAIVNWLVLSASDALARRKTRREPLLA